MSKISWTLKECPILTERYVKPFWDNAITTYRRYGHDVSYMSYRMSLTPMNNDGVPAKNFNPNAYGACWTKRKIVYVNPEFRRAYFFHTKHQTVTPQVFAKSVQRLIAHELAHEIWHTCNDQFRNEILNKVAHEHFTTDYLAYYDVADPKYKEEAFAEYLAHQVS